MPSTADNLRSLDKAIRASLRKAGFREGTAEFNDAKKSIDRSLVKLASKQSRPPRARDVMLTVRPRSVNKPTPTSPRQSSTSPQSSRSTSRDSRAAAMNQRATTPSKKKAVYAAPSGIARGNSTGRGTAGDGGSGGSRGAQKKTGK